MLHPAFVAVKSLAILSRLSKNWDILSTMPDQRGAQSATDRGAAPRQYLFDSGLDCPSEARLERAGKREQPVRRRTIDLKGGRMKLLRLSMVVIVSLVFLAGPASMALSRDAGKEVPGGIKPPKGGATCPAGWHVSQHLNPTTGSFRCMPTEPAPIKCSSDKFEYFSSAQGGCCYVGCREKTGGRLSAPVKKGETVPGKSPEINTRSACPAGWHLASGSLSGAFNCGPNKPAQFNCPAGLSYQVNSDCPHCGLGCVGPGEHIW